jgi:hypothetical protein
MRYQLSKYSFLLDVPNGAGGINRSRSH